MNKGVNLRFAIHNILYEIYSKNTKLDSKYIKKKISIFDKQDRAFIINVCLNTMRYCLHVKKIKEKFIKKNSKINEEILFLSSITQLVFLNFKDYAVVNSSVEIAKKLNIYHGFVNATLKKISKQKDVLKKIKIDFDDLPIWFINKTKNFTNNQKINFLREFSNEPNLHLVFKKKEDLLKFNHKIKVTSEISCFLNEKILVENLSFYKEGIWWVQDFSSFFPLYSISNNLLNGNNIDLCSAPGGKSFQVLSKDKKINLNEISIERTKILKENLRRLNYEDEITNFDILEIDTKKKYDFVLLDSPCSAIGTIRKNPEIFFRKNGPNFEYLLELQKELLNKAAELLNKNGVLLYMVCSFLEEETFYQVENFLRKNNEFKVKNYFTNSSQNYNFLIKDKFIHTHLSSIENFKIDGYFAVCLEKYS